MNVSRKQTAWKKSRKFGDVKGGRKFPKITDRIFRRAHSLRPPATDDPLPVFISENPSRDFYFPVTGQEIAEHLEKLSIDRKQLITHVWLRKTAKREYLRGIGFQGAFMCGSGVRAIVLFAFPRDLRMIVGRTKPAERDIKFYSKWNCELGFDESEKNWFLKWKHAEIRDYYLNFLLPHEIGHFVESFYDQFWSKAKTRRRESFADDFAFCRIREFSATKDVR